MSNRVLSAAFQHSESKGAARLVLIAMADEANDQGLLTAYRRSQNHLAAKCNLDVRSVRRAIDQLEELGEVVVLTQGDGRTQSDYQIVLPDLAPPDPSSATGGGQNVRPRQGGRNVRPGGGPDARPGGAERPPSGGSVPAPSSPSPPFRSPTPPTPPQAGGEDDPDEQLVLVNPPADPTPEQTFDVFWQRFPGRHGGPPIRKEKARERWAKLDLATQRAAAKGAAAYARFCEEQDRYPKDPDRWLRDRMWVDFLDERASTPAAHRPTGPAVREPVPVELTDVDALPHRAVDLADPEVVARQAAEARKRLGRAG